jgi:sortase A
MNLRSIFGFALLGAGVVCAVHGARDAVAVVPGIVLGNRSAPSLAPSQAELSIPRLHARWALQEGINDESLRRGPGHVPGAAALNAEGNCAIAGHRDTHFRILRNIRRGDRVTVQTAGGLRNYVVQSIAIVRAEQTESLQPMAGRHLHLITCFPFYYVGPSPKRFVVHCVES